MFGILDSNIKIVTSGLISHLDAGQKRCFPGSGSVMTDVSGQGKNATISGTYTYQSSFGGLTVSNSAHLIVTGITTSNSWTVCTFVRCTDFNGKGCIILGQGTNQGSKAIYAGFNSATQFAFEFYGNDATFAVSVSNNTWYYVVCAYNSSTYQKIFSLNNSKQTANGGAYSGSGNFLIGKGRNGLGAINGDLGNSLIYDRVLTDAEILQNYDACKKRYGL